MTSKSLLLFVVACAVAVASGRHSTLSGQDAAAKAWLRAHTHKGKQAPDQDDLAELKTENPTAYAIVKTLLTKNSLGLIKRKDDAGITVDEDGEAEGSQPQSASSGQNFFHWKPADDSAMVKNVLGQVASLTATNSDVTSDVSSDQQKVDQGAASEIAAAAAADKTETVAASAETTAMASSVAKATASSAVESTATSVEESTSSRTNRYAGVSTANSDSLFAAGASAIKHSSSSSSNEAAEEKKPAGWGSIFGAFNKPATPKAVKKPTASLATAATSTESNSYLKGFDWGMDMKRHTAPAGFAAKMSPDNAYAGFLSY